ncbi:phosphinothricin acetyltransferase [Vibrio sp. qd031]|uniref:GNAT family N-acetyltransferase n=1 Tax=Vibrio sp. qd031 TaxID=1603038 RepID=UPI000A10E6B3|nr:GNAT family N-acetyltransferase [Vibrio sp. qd031]ORT50175.1 phosphinothricin acetyltransferase [Vibrio sp. qd031]
MKIRIAEISDANEIANIYNHYITESTITFEESTVSVNQMKERIETLLGSGFPWIVLEGDSKIIGYAYASPWNSRTAYRFTVESTIYLDPQASGKGNGRRLYTNLLNRLYKQEIRNVMGVIALPNPSSIALHESLGFNKVGEFSNIGFKFEREISVGYWQLEQMPNKLLNKDS